MPVYEYKCTACEQHFDIEQSFTDDALTSLEGCEIDAEHTHRLKKVFSAVGIAFKGDGFYRNDARGSKNPSKATAGATGDSASSSSSGSDSSSTTPSSSSSSDSSSSSSGSSATASPPSSSSSTSSS